MGTVTTGALAAALGEAQPGRARDRRPPNIVFILADDMGVGDVSCLNPASGIHTPSIDRLAREGITFTDAHTPSSVCTPTRYGLLTGRYCWRTRLKVWVLLAYQRHLIAPGRVTVPSLLKERGYSTGCVGKWHLGFDWGTRAGASPEGDAVEPADIDYSRPITQGPLDVGFDSFFGIPASLDMDPYVFVQDDHVVTPPDHEVPAGLFGRPGPCAPGFEADRVAPELTKHAVEFVDRQSADRPFLLYFPLSAPHTPIAPSAPFRGRSRAGPYGDFCEEVDDAVGRVMQALERRGLADNTLFIFTADNGFSPAAGVREIEATGHHPSMGWRGYKADIWEGGHRVPFFARWPGVARPGSTCDGLICLTDLLATVAEMHGVDLPNDAAEDSVSFLHLLEGREAARQPRDTLVMHSVDGEFAIRRGAWKLAMCAGSGGWSTPKDAEALSAGQPGVQLYNLDDDPGETHNLASDKPETIRELTDLLTTYVTSGRSTPGAPQRNDGPQWWPQLTWINRGTVY